MYVYIHVYICIIFLCKNVTEPVTGPVSARIRRGTKGITLWCTTFTTRIFAGEDQITTRQAVPVHTNTHRHTHTRTNTHTHIHIHTHTEGELVSVCVRDRIPHH